MFAHTVRRIETEYIPLSTVGIAYADNNLSRYSGFFVGAQAGAVFNNVELKSHQLGFTNLENTCNKYSDFSTWLSGIQFRILSLIYISIVILEIVPLQGDPSLSLGMTEVRSQKLPVIVFSKGFPQGR